VDTKTDNGHCGRCFSICEDGKPFSHPPCVDGKCTCPEGLKVCTFSYGSVSDVAINRCFNLSIERNHCGACDNICQGIGGECENGVCKCTKPGFVPCKTTEGTKTLNTCRDLNNDKNNCGACGNKCGEDQVCSQGESIFIDPTRCKKPGETRAVVVTKRTDEVPEWCSRTCGNASCDDGQTCSEGECVFNTTFAGVDNVSPDDQQIDLDDSSSPDEAMTTTSGSTSGTTNAATTTTTGTTTSETTGTAGRRSTAVPTQSKVTRS